ncbi:hypothetical protein V1524DRAFT_83290 [Lipomyces starkeyi]
MASSVHPSGSEQKSLIETLRTILRQFEGWVYVPLIYANHEVNVIDLALALLNHSLSPESLSDNLWTHLADENHKINELSQFLSPVRGSFHEVASLTACVPKPPLTWENVAQEFEKSEFLMGVLEDWTLPFFFELLIPMKATGRTPTPSDGSTASRSTSLKQKLLDRDGWFSAVGLVMDPEAPANIIPTPDQDYDYLEVAHIIPFSASSRSSLRTMLSRFAGQDICDLLTGANINDPSNALLLPAGSHKFFDAFQFGLECQNRRYFLRKVPGTRLNRQLQLHDEGDEIIFGRQSRRIPPPSPLFCNLQLAVGRVMRASGAAETIDMILKDEDEFNRGSVEGDYWHRVGASYLRRKLGALQGCDKLSTDRYDDDINSSDKDLRIMSHRAIYT